MRRMKHIFYTEYTCNPCAYDTAPLHHLTIVRCLCPWYIEYFRSVGIPLCTQIDWLWVQSNLVVDGVGYHSNWAGWAPSQFCFQIDPCSRCGSCVSELLSSMDMHWFKSNNDKMMKLLIVTLFYSNAMVKLIHKYVHKIQSHEESGVIASPFFRHHKFL